jgi:hypothetical protein
MKTKLLFFVFFFVLINCSVGQNNWRPFNLDSVKKNEKIILSVLHATNDKEILSFLKKRQQAAGLRYIGLLSVPMIIAGGLSLLYADPFGLDQIKTKEQFRFRDGGRSLFGLAALSLAVKVKFDCDHKKYYKKALEKYVLLNN